MLVRTISLFSRIVVYKNHAVEADVQHLLYQADIVYFVVPIRQKDREVIHPQDHFGMLFKRLPRDVLRILAIDRERDPSLLKLLCPVLEFCIGLADAQRTDFYIVDPIVPDDAAPGGVIEIQDQAFIEPA